MALIICDLATPIQSSPHPCALQLKKSHNATRWLFAMFGTLGGVWGVHVPALKAHYALTEGSLSIVLLSTGLGAVASLFVAGRVIAWLGVQRTVVATAFVMSALLAAVLHWPNMAVLLCTGALFGCAMSVFDVAINDEGSTIESLGGRAVMSHLHGMFSVGAMAGAGAAAGLLRLGMGADAQFQVTGVLMFGVVAFVSRQLLVQVTPSIELPVSHFTLPRGVLMAIGLLMFCSFMAEGSMGDWSVLYLHQELHMSPPAAGAGLAIFTGAMAAMRFAGDRLRARYAEHAVLAWGAATAALAMTTVLMAQEPTVALVGFGFVGAGLAPIVPILYAAASRVPGTTRSAAIASVASIGYAGLLLGPPIIGGIAQHWSLSTAMVVVAMMAAAIAACAWIVRAAHRT